MRVTLPTLALLVGCVADAPPKDTAPGAEGPEPLLIVALDGAATFGAAVAGGDVDGDGLADLVIGVPSTTAGDSGAVYVCLGDASAPLSECGIAQMPAGTGQELTVLPDDTVIVGVTTVEADELRALRWTEGVPTVEADGTLSSEDRASSLAPMPDEVDRFVLGSTTNYWGEGRGAVLFEDVIEGVFSPLGSLQANALDAAWAGDTGFGAYLASPGDTDGDGAADLVVGARRSDTEGSVHVVAGPPLEEGMPASRTLTGPGGLHGVSGGDADGDGLADVAIVWDAAVAVHLGGVDGVSAEPTFSVPVTAAGADLGGDLDGDGHADLAVADAGVVTVHLGGPDGFTGDSVALEVPDRLVIPGDAPLGDVIRWLGDIDGDGRDELAAASVHVEGEPGYVLVFPAP